MDRANNDPAKAAAVYGATTTRYANQLQHQSNQDNRQNNWNNKTPNQKAVDYNAATIHHSNTEATQAARKTPFHPAQMLMQVAREQLVLATQVDFPAVIDEPYFQMPLRFLKIERFKPKL